MSVEFTESAVITYRTEKCYLCAVPFAMESAFAQRRREHGEEFYCPNGHRQFYCSPVVAQLRSQIENKERELRVTKCQVLEERNLREKAEASKVRILKRIHTGICPKCNRSFTNLRRHMESKHKC